MNEEELRMELRMQERWRELKHRRYNRGELLLDHYTKPECIHPDDQYLPLNRWEEVKREDGAGPGTGDPGARP